MRNVQPTGCYQKQEIANDVIIYHYNHLPPGGLSSFQDAFNPAVWKDYFKPFACAIVNPHAQEIILVRDHLGIAPLYYSNHLDNLIIGQTIPDVLNQLPRTPPFLESQIELLFSEKKAYSDETLYQGIYRVEPGHFMHFKANGSVVKKAFWQLEPQGAVLHYADDQDYLDHFSLLMKESMINATEGHQNIAAEFSAGLDSSAVYCAAVDTNVRPTLFMHTALPDTKAAKVYNDCYEKAFIDHYQLTNIQRIGAEDFDPIQVLKKCASWFAGPAPYLFFVFAHNIHRAVSTGGHPILLSGFGGDQGVSGQIPLNFFMPDLIHRGAYQQAWHELKGTKTNSPLQSIKRSLQYMQYLHPALYECAMTLKNIKRQLRNTLYYKTDPQPCSIHPYQRKLYNSTREAEWFFLQGPHNHEVRMRIEYSSIVSQKMGFEYRYPLLHPKLLEFIVSLPLQQKRHRGQGRYLIRQYLSQFLPGDVFGTYRKQEGLGIVPSTFDLFQKKFEQGCYRHDFSDLPYADKIKHKHHPIEIRNTIKGFMLKPEVIGSR